MLEHDPVARRLIAAALGEVVDRTVRTHVAGITQEPALTARTGQALEHELDGRIILGRRTRPKTSFRICAPGERVPFFLAH